MKSHKELDVWKLAIETGVELYEHTSRFPKHELYGLSSQMRRACVSIASNIAEGAARNSKKDYVRFLYIALGSCAELETQLEIVSRLGYLERDILDTLFEKEARIAQMILGVVRRWKK